MKIRLLFQIFFGSSFGSRFEFGFKFESETFVLVPDRIQIRPKVSDPSGSNSGSGSATLENTLLLMSSSSSATYYRYLQCSDFRLF
jgi:hypothetical protein